MRLTPSASNTNPSYYEETVKDMISGKKPFGLQKSDSALRQRDRSQGENHDESLEELVTNSDLEDREFSAIGGVTSESRKQQSPFVVQSEEVQEFAASCYDPDEAKHNQSSRFYTFAGRSGRQRS